MPSADMASGGRAIMGEYGILKSFICLAKLMVMSIAAWVYAGWDAREGVVLGRGGTMKTATSL